jgi:death-on-curing protein
VRRPAFLTLDEVLGIHSDQIRRYGGRAGVRDVGLLKSALAMPRATFEQQLLHGTVFEQAAAYLFHLARNHPFADGNKRTALMCTLVFLGTNGQRLSAPAAELYDLVVAAAVGKVDKSQIAVFIRSHCVSR